jgi:3,4-dihydroxy 2-butanone 4-phosphate synthase/GTP cyclohydrolase II
MINFDSIEEAIEDIKNGKMIIVVDDESRENEGDFIMAADKITPEAINFMATYGRGLICTPLTSKKAKELKLPLMVKQNDSLHHTAFTVSIDHLDAGTGISSKDRALTIEKLAENNTRPTDFVRPGHIFPLIARNGGVLVRDGHTEAAVDFSRLAGHSEVGVICEIMNENGTMARAPELRKIADKYNLKFVTIKDLIIYREKNEKSDSIDLRPIVYETSKIDFPCKYGEFKLHIFETPLINEGHHIAIIKGNIKKEGPILVRVHSECFTGDIFGSLRCDCGDQLADSMKMIEKAGCGVLLYLKQEGRGIGLPNKIKAYELQDKGLDTVQANIELGHEADSRDYSVGAEMLKILGIKNLELITNNPLKIKGLEDCDVQVVKRCPIEIDSNNVNHQYLKTKKEKMGHILNHIQ